MLNRRLIRNFDFYLLLIVIALCAVGTFTLYSATRNMEGLPDPLYFVKRQLLFMGVGAAIMLLVCFIDYVNFKNWTGYLYGANLVLLGLVLVIGEVEKGAMRRIPIGFFDLQPSEIAKVIIIITLARLLAEKEGQFPYFRDLFPSLAATALPMALIFLQPDLGTSLVFLAILLGMLYVAGAQGRHLGLLIGSGVAVSPIFWFYLLEEYQKNRLIAFINPELDPTDKGWQLLQSIIGIGSGGLLGKGPFNSTQVRLGFLPDHYTDMIFAVFGEEMGYVGAVSLLLLYTLLIYRIFWISTQAKDQFGALLCCGVAVMFFFQVMVNIGMTISLMPVTGIPLPFMSYGNNALLVNLTSIGLVLNVAMRRHKIQF
ncbi:MAG TPA: rod shape-determining protein RodA [Bacillota bacterium]|nr:rod shape-determining protein RodA [Bacillota bacterium]